MNTVLIVEDHADTLASMAQLVGSEGHSVLTASSVSEGMAHLSAAPTHALLDLDLPDGKSILIVNHVRAEKLPIKVAIITGTRDEKSLAEAKACGPDALFKKPAKWDTLKEWIAA